MRNRQKFLVNMLFRVITIIIFIVACIGLVDVKIALLLMFACLGCQQLFIGSKFYKDDKETRKWNIGIGIGCFLFLFILKTKHLI